MTKRNPVSASAGGWLIAAAICLLGPWPVAFAADDESEPAVDPKLFQALEYRNIGPYRGGRSTAVTGVIGDRDTFYMGTTGGGIWKTADGGQTWTNVSDEHFEAASIGAVTVAPSDPNVVYAGTGSACPRGNVSPGIGVYRSTDAGATWTHVGLREAGQIGRIRVHANDPDRVYVAALGHIFGPNEDRGVFRSVDGGATWDKVLYVNEHVGAVDLALDPNNPRILYAAMWRAERKPWTLISGGEGNGLYKSSDGGDSWEQLTDGLPGGTTGRIGVSVSAAKRNRVYALVEAEKGGLFRSEDGGKSFRLINEDRNFRQRAWYYTHVYADPGHPETVYVLNTGLWRSTDGGEDFSFIRVPHGDQHDLWIHPEDPQVLINANDGGANVSYNGGKSWSTQENQPTAEMYRVSVDDQFPYRVYGCQQDNSCVSLPSRTSSGGIARPDWWVIGGCESGHVAIDPRDPDVTYSGCYGGTIGRYDHETDQEREIMAWPQLAVGQAPKDLKYRFQWNAPIRISPHDPNVLYHTSQYVHRTTDEGQSWELISPDLSRGDEDRLDYAGEPITRDNTGVEVYATVFAFEPSRHERGLLWAGTDDGRVHVSRDDGASWQEITPKKMPDGGQVNMIELSPHGAGRAFLAVTRYKFDDFRPYIYRTDDYGKSWKLLTDGDNGIPADHFVRVVREDPDRKGLLYAGTEFGLYVSFDDGARWQSLQLKLPHTPISDLQVHRQDLVVATQGRSFWILDDLTPLHGMSDEVAKAEAYLFEPRDAWRFGGGGGFGGRGGAAGENPPRGVVVHYVLNRDLEPKEGGDEGDKPAEVTLEVLDTNGEVLRTMSSLKDEPRAPSIFARFRGPGPSRKLPAKEGMNRWVWNLRLPDAKIEKESVLWGSARGPEVPPGTYRVRLSVGGEEVATHDVTLEKDPRIATTRDGFERQFELSKTLWKMLTESHETLHRLRDVRTQVADLTRRLKDAGKGDGLEEIAERIEKRLTEVEETIHQTKAESSQDVLNYPPKLDNQIAALKGVVESADARPTDASVQRYEELRAELDAVERRLDEVLDTDVREFDEAVAALNVPFVIVGGESRPEAAGMRGRRDDASAGN